MACRAVRQRPINCFQMVLKQDAAIFGDALANCESTKCRNEGVDKLKPRLTYEQTIRPIY